MKFYPEWDVRCSDILRRHAGTCTNGEIVDLIEQATGLRFSVYAISRRRARLGLPSPHRNDWSAPITQWRNQRARSN
jgi:hypothetical protein